jgi:4-azaleucine resistance transporter AzlC
MRPERALRRAAASVRCNVRVSEHCIGDAAVSDLAHAQLKPRLGCFATQCAVGVTFRKSAASVRCNVTVASMARDAKELRRETRVGAAAGKLCDPRAMSPEEPAADPRPRDGVVAALPLAVAVGLFGISFGVLADAEAGMGAAATVVMSITTFGGSAQFAAASVLAAGGQPIAAIVAAVLLNLRYLPIGISVASAIRGSGLRRLLTSQVVVDESWAIAARGDGRFSARLLVGAGITLWLAWVAGTLIGVIGGAALGDPAALGLDAAFPALFLALLVAQLRSRTAVGVAVAGALVSLALVPFVPPGVPIVAAGMVALVGWWRR